MPGLLKQLSSFELGVGSYNKSLYGPIILHIELLLLVEHQEEEYFLLVK